MTKYILGEVRKVEPQLIEYDSFVGVMPAPAPAGRAAVSVFYKGCLRGDTVSMSPGTYNGKDRYMFGRGQNFPVPISKIREALQKNRAEHLEIVEEAQEGFKKKVIEELARALEDAKNGVRYQTTLNLQMPQSQLREFDNAIDFLEDVEKGLKLTGQPPVVQMTSEEYERFVRNKWDWMQNFVATSSRYSAKAQALYENQI